MILLLFLLFVIDLEAPNEKSPHVELWVADDAPLAIIIGVGETSLVMGFCLLIMTTEVVEDS